jgi:hypothetical protein
MKIDLKRKPTIPKDNFSNWNEETDKTSAFKIDFDEEFKDSVLDIAIIK